MNKEIIFKRSNGFFFTFYFIQEKTFIFLKGQLQKAFVFCVCKNDMVGLTWLENNERFIKFLKR